MRRLDPQKVMKNVGRCVAAIRISRGLTQQGLADELGITVNYVQRVEIGNSNMTIHTLVRWANWLDIEPALLFANHVGEKASRASTKK